MKKTLITCAMLLLTAASFAQNLTKKIPKNAFAVATIKGDNIFKLMFVKDFNESFLGKKILTEASQSQNKPINSIEDFGINLTQNMYYFNQTNDSVTYNCFLIPLQDAAKFEGFFKNQNQKISTADDVKTLILADSSGVLKWNSKTLVFLLGKIKSSFFADSIKSAKYGIKNVSYAGAYNAKYNGDSTVVDSVTTISEAMPTTAVSPPNSAQIDRPQKAKTKKSSSVKGKKTKTARNKTANKRKPKKTVYEHEGNLPIYSTADTIAPPTVTESYYDDKYYADYEKEYAAQQQKIKILNTKWTLDQAKKILTAEYPSIEENKDYNNSLDKNAIAELWISDLTDLYKIALSGFSREYEKRMPNLGYEHFYSKLYADKNSFKLTMDFKLSKNEADFYSKITKRKLNKNFLKYIESDKAIAFLGYATDTKAYLQELPKKIKRYTSSFLGINDDQIMDIGADIFSTLLDEEAVAKVINGDALIVVNGVTSRNVTYKTYDYDDDYNQKEVTKTKKESIPDFLAMFSSEDPRIFKKLLNYGVTKDVVRNENDVYEVTKSKSPIPVFFLIKDNIVFIGSNKTELINIKNNKYNTKISSEHKKMLSKKNFSFLFSPQKLIGKIPEDEFGGAETAKKFNDTFSKMGNISLQVDGLKNNVISSEIKAEIPNGHENALKYLFSLIETASK